jgi:23S rRNA pseudouridine1911/1915/1917 synthase
MDWVISLPDRLDVFLSRAANLPSRGKAQEAIEAGRVTVNGNVVTKSACRLQEGDQVTLADAEDEDGESTEYSITSIPVTFDILWEDDDCFVIDKPAGIAVHPGAGMPPGEATVLHGIAALFETRKIPFSASSILVHRLDRETTGCLLIAKTPAAHVELQRQFAARTVQKQYLAIVAGVPSPAIAVIDAPIGRSLTERTKMGVERIGKSREARTTYKTLGAGAQSALLVCDLHTGRTHQVRVHLHAIGHPILGDGTYATILSERVTEELAVRSLCLHAWTLTFDPPSGAMRVTVTAPLPASFRQVLRSAGISEPS